MKWFVTIQKNGRVQRRMMEAETAKEACDKTRDLIGGPQAHTWSVVSCTSEINVLTGE